MKKILALLLVCSVVDAGPYWNVFDHRYSDPPQPPKFPSYQHAAKHTHQHHYETFDQPKYTTSWPSYNLDNVRLQVIQDCSPKDECSLAVLCRNPATNVMMITEIGSATLAKQNETPNSGDRSVDNPNTQINNNKDINNGGPTTTPQPPTVKTPSYHGGEGLIDVRFGEED